MSHGDANGRFQIALSVRSDDGDDLLVDVVLVDMTIVVVNEVVDRRGGVVQQGASECV